MTGPIDITTARGATGRATRIAVVLPVAGTPGTGALATGARALTHGAVRRRAHRGSTPVWPGTR